MTLIVNQEVMKDYEGEEGGKSKIKRKEIANIHKGHTDEDRINQLTKQIIEEKEAQNKDVRSPTALDKQSTDSQEEDLEDIK